MNNWNIKEDYFKTKKDMKSRLKFLLRYAILAPSGYNIQPWKFRIKGDEIEVWADFANKRGVIDPSDRESYISVGAALENLLIASKYFGFETKVSLEKVIKIDKGLDKIAIVKLNENGLIKDEANGNLFLNITKRQTNRRPFESIDIKAKKLESQIVSFVDDGVKIKMFDEENIKRKMATLMTQASLYWYGKENFRKELMSWLRDDTETKNTDGIWQKYYDGKDRLGVLNYAEDKAVRDEMLVLESPILMVVSSKKDNKEAWIETGRNLERALLYLTYQKISHAYFNTIVESDKHRLELKKELNNGGTPQLVLRLGRAKRVKRASRKRLRDVLIS